ncbi:DUF692 family protein [Oceanobacillus piezotolerans]|uniref:DUF692 family protein n=1 Tax=Oceanobacillus piezotolerans TaxID=2448030 RepID=A0A498D3K6_9BACI|nr:DUF692 family multinuclear iron-containing protein [Oceanobacillus piezotolerans]RLL42791.1 DUF692 family protein [Oceanobacillus piezotolerans]
MKFAMNYSEEAKKLVDTGKITIDMFKCPDFDENLIDRAKESKEVYVHFDVNAGDHRLDKVDWGKVEKLAKETNTPFINMHMVAFAKDYPHYDPGSGVPELKDAIIENVIQDINEVTARFGNDKVILENVVFIPHGNMQRLIIEPHVVTAIIKETNCGLLLDTAHAQMTCKYTKMSVYDYINQLPVHAIKELHVTGIQSYKGKLRDSMPMTEDDFELVKWVISNMEKGKWPTPWVASFEYGGVGPLMEWRSEEKVMKEQVPKLYQLLKKQGDGT